MAMSAITDSQIHVWGAATVDRPWPEGGQRLAHRAAPLGADEVIERMDAAGVARAVLVPPSWEGDRNDLALDAANRYPDRFGVMGRIDLAAGPQATPLEAWRSVPGLLGGRLTFHRPPARQWLTDGTAEWVWGEAERVGLPLMVFAPGLTDVIARVAGSHPGLKIIVDHLNLSTEVKAEALGPSLRPVFALSDFSNVAVKASALPCYVDEGYPFSSLHRPVRQVIDAFGADRVLWGSDLSRLPCPYLDWVRFFTDQPDLWSPEEVDLALGGAASQWLGWPVAL
jgi:predicted TIM-barrel fold metal-dependent hydrolase